MDAEVSVKTTVQRATVEGFVEVEHLFFATHVKAQMPFADHVGGVALIPKQMGNGSLFFRDDGLAFGKQGVEYPGAHGVNPGEQAVTGRGARAGCGMGIGEADAFAGEPLQVRGFDFGLWVGDGAIAVAEVVGEDQNDIGGFFHGYGKRRVKSEE